MRPGRPATDSWKTMTFLGEGAEGAEPSKIKMTKWSPIIRNSKWTVALKLTKDLPVLRVKLNISHYNSLISACHLWLEALSYFQDLSMTCLRSLPDIISFNAVAGACNRWDLVLGLISKARGNSQQLDRITFHSLLKSLNDEVDHRDQGRRWIVGLESIEIMNRYGICLQRSTFTHLLQAVSSSIRWYQSLDCLSSAQIFDCNHCDVVCCNVAVHALSKAFAWMVAIKLLSTFPQLLVRPDAVSHNALTDDQWGTVFVLMQEMKLGSIRTTTKWYNHAAHIASAGSGKWAKTLGFCHHAWQVQLPPDVVTVNTCLQHLSFVQEWEWAVVWWKNMEVKTGGDQVTNTILTSTKTWTEGLAFLRELSWNRQTLSRTICTAAIKTLEGSDCWTEALSLLRHEADVTSYSAAAACLKQHLWPKAFHLIRMIGQAGFQNDIVSVNSVLGVLTPRWNLAASVFKSMQTAQLEASQISHCAILHTLAIESGISAGAHLWRNALGSFVALGNAGLQIDTASCNAILGSLEKCGQWRESLILMRKDRELSDEITFNAAICACEKAELTVDKEKGSSARKDQREEKEDDIRKDPLEIFRRKK